MTKEYERATLLRRAVEVSIGVGVVILGVTLCRRTIILSDEGYLLMQALDMAHGKVLYRDMDSFVAPGAWFVLAALFRMVEPSVIATRMVALVAYLGMVWTCFRIADRLAGRRSACATAVALGVFTVWAFPAWTVSFYSPYAVLCALVALERVLAWQATDRGRDLVWAGVSLGLAIVFKQNYGVFALAGCAVAVLLSLLGRGGIGGVLPAALRLGSGAIVSIIPSVGYFLYHSAAADAFDALVMHPFRGFLVAHRIPYLGLSEIFDPQLSAGVGRFTYGAYPMVKTGLHLRWTEGSIRFVEQLHVVMYWVPVLVFALAGALVVRSLARRSLDVGLASVLSVAGLVFLGVFPRADFNHLVNVYQPVVLLGVVVVQRVILLSERWSWRSCSATLACLLLAPYAFVAASWYVSLLDTLRTPLASPRGGVLIDQWEAAMIDFEVETIRALTRSDEPVLTVPGLAMLNFLAERSMPSRYYNLYAVHIAHDGGAGVVAEAERSGGRLAVVDYNNFFSDPVGLSEYAPVLAGYLRRSFAPVLSVAVDKHLVLARRSTPLPDRALVSPLEDCDARPAAEFGERIIRDHLFFEALYHFLEAGGDGERQVRETECRVHVPDNARLRGRIGYRQPRAVGDDVRLSAEMWARTDEVGGAARLLEADVPTIEQVGWGSPAPVEYEVDLSHLAGQDVTLVLRTVFDGEVEVNPLALWGFAMVWQDLQMEYDRGSAPEDGGWAEVKDSHR